MEDERQKKSRQRTGGVRLEGFEEWDEFNRYFQIDLGKIASAARKWIKSATPKQTRRLLPWLLFKSFFYGGGRQGKGEGRILNELPVCCLLDDFLYILSLKADCKNIDLQECIFNLW